MQINTSKYFTYDPVSNTSKTSETVYVKFLTMAPLKRSNMKMVLTNS